MSETEEKIAHLKRPGPDAIAIAVLAAVLIFFYWGFLTGRSYMWDDTLMYHYPVVNYFAKSIQAGRFPLWFPGIHDGEPFYSDPQISVFYPPQWLLVPFVKNGRLPFVVYQRYIVFHYLLGGLFLYAFLRRIRLDATAALMGATVFCLSGFASLRISTFVMMQVAVWLPLQLWCVERVVSGENRWDRAALIGAMLMCLLAGHQQTTIYCWYLVVAYWLFRRYSQYREQGSDCTLAIRKTVTGDWAKLLGTFALVAGLGAVVMVPAAQNWSLTEKSNLTYDIKSDMSLPYDQLLTLFVPNFFGETKSLDSPAPFWGYDPHSVTLVRNGPVNSQPGYWQYWEFGVYTGLVFWIVLPLALFNWATLKNRQIVGFFSTVWVLAIWFMLGRYGGLYWVLYHSLPGVSLFRAPARMASLATFSAAVLVAYSVDTLRRNGRGLRCWPVFLSVAVCAGLALILFFGLGHWSSALRHPERLHWAQSETLFALVVGTIAACAAIVAVRIRQSWAGQVCLCILFLVTVADFHHAYGSFQQGSANPDAAFPETDKLLPLLQDYRENRGPFRFGQTNRGKISEEIATFRNLPFFHDFLEVPEGYSSFYLDSVKSFSAITNENAKIAIQNIVVSMDRDAAGKDWLDTHTNSFPRVKFFPRVRHYDSRVALLGALEGGQIDWRHEAADDGVRHTRTLGPGSTRRRGTF